ncbi:GDP-L-fucose synthase [Sporolactobacillus sp. CQH2019]|uniref:GDP-L-fucose synthase family protein n=1 Tax=Sporolactobacillus sp. CQH2019 TaxID=3023512 RepID=UPI002368D875|nr:GDP-L-fucose synthase [Sporolactobacillus sp. CQH2019]MDD9148780.1 GDP-L-fucose synthase [Sporolactobacillus sp. CQH2019]
MEKNSCIYVAGHTGLVGSALVRSLNRKGYKNIIGRTHGALDLTNQAAVEDFFAKEKIDYVFLAAAKVGGIGANRTYPADFIMDNLLMECNVIKSAFRHKVKKLLFLGSSCIYPKLCPQPIKEEYLLTGPLEPTNEAYALAKISGLKMCSYYKEQYGANFISAMPTNLYGLNDKFGSNGSHVIPAILSKMEAAKRLDQPAVKLWGTGTPLREFLFADDMADACVHLMETYNGRSHINIGTGRELSIRDLAELIKKTVDYKGDIVFDPGMPDGTPRKLLDSSRIEKLGWKAKIGLEEGLRLTYDSYIRSLRA